MGEIYDAANAAEAGLHLRDLEPHPTQALIDGVLHLRRESVRVEARKRRDGKGRR